MSHAGVALARDGSSFSTGELTVVLAPPIVTESDVVEIHVKL